MEAIKRIRAMFSPKGLNTYEAGSNMSTEMHIHNKWKREFSMYFN